MPQTIHRTCKGAGGITNWFLNKRLYKKLKRKGNIIIINGTMTTKVMKAEMDALQDVKNAVRF